VSRLLKSPDYLYIQVIGLLVASGADVAAQDKDGMNALHNAAMQVFLFYFVGGGVVAGGVDVVEGGRVGGSEGLR